MAQSQHGTLRYTLQSSNHSYTTRTLPSIQYVWKISATHQNLILSARQLVLYRLQVKYHVKILCIFHIDNDNGVAVPLLTPTRCAWTFNALKELVKTKINFWPLLAYSPCNSLIEKSFLEPFVLFVLVRTVIYMQPIKGSGFNLSILLV